MAWGLPEIIGWVTFGPMGYLAARLWRRVQPPGVHQDPAQLSSSGYGRPRPIIYGTRRQGGMLVWLGDRKTKEVEAGTNHIASFVQALGEGPSSVLAVWGDLGKYWAQPEDVPIEIRAGDPASPSIWPALLSKAPDQALAYNGLTLAVRSDWDMGTAGVMPSLAYEVKGHCAIYEDPATGVATPNTEQRQWSGIVERSSPTVTLPASPVGVQSVISQAGTQYASAQSFSVSGAVVTVTTLPGTPGIFDHIPVTISYTVAIPSTTIYRAFDANPADVIADLLTNDQYGAGQPASLLSDMTQFRSYCDAAGFYLSPAISEQKPALEHVRGIVDACNCELLWSADGKLKIVPYGDTPITRGSFTYTPDTTPVYAFDHDDYLTDGPEDDPVEVVRVPQSEVMNVVPVEWTNRSRHYDPDTVESPEEADITLTGETRRAPVVSLPAITRKEVAQQISRIFAQRSVYIRNSYRWRVSWRGLLAEAMDLVTITDTKLGITNKPVRIVRVRFEMHKGAPSFLIEAEEWPLGVATAPRYDLQSADGAATNRNVSPGAPEVPVVVPVPALLAGEQPAIWIGATGLSDAYGGCDVYLSADNSAFSFVGTINGRTRMGPLTSELATGSALDTTHTLAVDLTDSRGILSSTSDQGRDDLENLCVVVNEV